MTTKESLRRAPSCSEAAGEGVVMTGQTPKKPGGKIEGQKHRGLRIHDLPGKGLRKMERLLRWKMFKLGEWPPVFWRVPLTIEGVALQQMLEERHGAFYQNVGKRQLTLAEGGAAAVAVVDGGLAGTEPPKGGTTIL